MAQLRAVGITRFRCAESEVLPEEAEQIDVGVWCRPILEAGQATLLVREVEAGESTVRWRIADKERIKEY